MGLTNRAERCSAAVCGRHPRCFLNIWIASELLTLASSKQTLTLPHQSKWEEKQAAQRPCQKVEAARCRLRGVTLCRVAAAGAPPALDPSRIGGGW